MEHLSLTTDTIGVTAYALTDDGVEVRSFAPRHGVSEDPACGSGNAAVGVHLRVSGGIKQVGSRYRARQGAAVGRAGELWVDVGQDDVTVGGSAVTVIDGEIRLE